MPRPYFRQVPNFEYINRNPGDKYLSEYIPVKNLFKRGKLREDIFGNLAFFEKYSIIGDERPDNVASKFYGDSTLDWVVLLSNNILNIQSEWPLSQENFDKVMLEKYGSYDRLYDVHHYETLEIKNSLGVTILKPGIRISPSWKNVGNFVEILNYGITNISSGNSVETSNIITVTMGTGIPGLEAEDQIYIENVSEPDYNGAHIVREVLSYNSQYIGDFEIRYVTSFTYELPSAPSRSKPRLSESEVERVLYTVNDSYPISRNLFETLNINDNISNYYEFWDAGLGYSVLKPQSTFVNAVTNYEYELQLEEQKRNIYILKPIYLNIVFNDMDDIMPYKAGSLQFLTETLKRGDNIRLYT
jgi:hypothetical protein